MTGCIEEHVPRSHYTSACCTTIQCGSRTLPDGSVQPLYILDGGTWWYTGSYIPRPGENYSSIWDCVCTGA
ncbi:hypothetical protein I6N90_00515 [Paenibacillus sp. GSMTC-2017]|uniref:hypothetical protein n=1 Tax=Paenibacillus sp. GSMTC-2017 TaxID=2794350 RepID=UPI0018D9B9FB|nr:hypothetical protein [Paenibacillus sp. GSMTC-2017]MBH5316289.1 hypothetical protein [Paenibacillus sp. GSMTC-2017]